MNVLLVEKEKKEVQKLVRILRLVDPSINVVETVSSINSLQEWVQHNPAPDIVLINQTKLPSLSVKNTSVLARLVLHTRQHSFTYLAFRTHAVAHLHAFSHIPEPATQGIMLATNKTEEEILLPLQPGVAQLFKNRFFVESGQRFLSVHVNEIAYFFSDGRFVYFITHARNKYIIHYRMEELEQFLNPEEFYRINRSFIISIKSIEQINPYFGSRFKLKLSPAAEEDILVSRNRAPGFRKWLGD